MPLSEIKNTIENFIIRDDNDALAIKGNYGVGKTYYWRELIKSYGVAKPYYSGFTEGRGKDRTIGKPQYIYVSLFGIEDLNSLKSRLFSEMVWSKNPESLSNRSGVMSKRIFNKLEKIPHIQKLTGDLISSLTFQEVKNALICFDDIDRKGSKLTVTEIIGLANLLKEQQNCKIVLILNEDGFEKPEEKNEFRKQVEKLIDFEIHFAPTTEDIIEYVFPASFANQEIVKAFCLRLKINNIRILQKTSLYIEQLSDFIKPVEKEVSKEILGSLILFVLSHYDKTNNVPTLEEIEHFDFTGFQVNQHLKKPNTERDIKIYEFLKNYDFKDFTELDKEILEFVKNGFPNKQTFSEKLRIKNEAIIAQNGVNKYRQAWKVYNDSFNCDGKEFIEQLTEGFIANIDYLEIRNLTQTVGILRQLGADEDANKLVDEYVEKRLDDNSMLLMRRGHIDFKVEDVYLKQKLQDKLNKRISNRTLEEVLERFNSSDPQYPEDVEFLKSVTEEEFYQHFKSYQSKQVENEIQFYVNNLYYQVKACLDFVNFLDEHSTIGVNAKRAIIRIALDCEINKVRVMNWFGINKEEIERE